MTFVNNRQLGVNAVKRKLALGEFRPTPTPGEAFYAGIDQTLSTENIGSRMYMDEMFVAPDREKIRRMRETGAITDDEWRTYLQPQGARSGIDTVDWRRLGEDMNEKHGTNFDFSAEAFNKKVQDFSNEQAETLNAAGGLSAFTGFGGGGVGVLVDPWSAGMIAATLPVGVTLGAGTTALSTVLRTGLFEGLLASTETAITQAFVWEFKNSVGIEHGMSDAAMNIALGFAGGSILGAGGGGVGYMLRARVNIERALRDGSVLDLEKVIRVARKTARGVEKLTEKGIIARADMADLDDLLGLIVELRKDNPELTAEHAMDYVNTLMDEEAMDVVAEAPTPSPDGQEPQIGTPEVEVEDPATGYVRDPEEDDLMVASMDDEGVEGEPERLGDLLDAEEEELDEMFDQLDQFEECWHG